MSSKPRYCRAPDQRRRRLGATGTLVGIAVDGAMAAAFVSMNTASAQTDEDGFEDLVQAYIDPNAFTSTCDTLIEICTPVDPNIWFEQLAYQLDTNLAPFVFGPELDTIADQIISAFTTTVF